MVQLNPPLSAPALLANLAGFTGTQGFYRHFLLVLLTDGTKYLAEKAECFWLMDIIASVQSANFRAKADGLQTWTVTVRSNDSASVVCAAGGVEIYRQEVPMTDFILGREEPFKLYVGPHSDGRHLVICLPSEN